MFAHQARVVLLPLLFALACGKPVDPYGKDDPLFTRASMTGVSAPQGPDRPLAADLAVEPVSMLVMFNRLKTPEKLQEALNKKPGQFSHLDLDKDNNPDPLTVAKKEMSDGHAFEIRARPSTGEYVVATMVFDPEWTFLGHYSGAMGGAASTHGRPLAVPSPSPAPPPTAAPAPTVAPVAVADVPTGEASAPGTPPAAPTADPASAAPAAAAGAVDAVPANTAKEAAVAAP